MLQAFIITLREGVEAALIVGITLAYLAKIGRNDLRKAVYAALGAAFVGSIGAAILLSRTKWNEDVFEGWIMLAAAFFVVTMIIFMMCGNGLDPVGGHSELEPALQLHRDGPGSGGGDRIWRRVRQGQR